MIFFVFYAFTVNMFLRRVSPGSRARASRGVPTGDPPPRAWRWREGYSSTKKAFYCRSLGCSVCVCGFLDRNILKYLVIYFKCIQT